MRTGVILKNIEYKHKICPLVFTNAKILTISLQNLVDTFYKKSVISFTNESYPSLNSIIESVSIENVQNVNLDLNLLHPSVFNYTPSILIFGTLNSIDGEIFMRLKNLLLIVIGPMIFRKINHKQGIEWIKQWNYGVNVNLTNLNQVQNVCKEIVLITNRR